MIDIPDNFTGYLNIGTDSYAFSVSEHIVTLLPANSDPGERSEIFSRLEAHNTGGKEILYGRSGIDDVAFMYYGKANRGSLNLSPSAKFSTSLIIKSAGNCFDHYARLTDRWDKFHAITFFGGNINSIFNPRIAIIGQKPEELVRADGAREIKIRPFEDYTQEVKLNIGGEEAALTLSIAQGGEGNDAEKNGAYNLGLLNSFIRITFNTAKGPETIPEYYRILHELISILTRQNNVSFGITLSQLNSNNQLYPSAICKTFDHYENYANKSSAHVASIICLVDYLPAIITKLSEHKADALLAVLPDNNKNTGRISITNVQDLCTALEVAYLWENKCAKKKKKKDELFKDFKGKIDEVIETFETEHPEFNAQNHTTLSCAFQYLSYNARTKILTLYADHKDLIDPIIKKWNLPQIDEESVTKFVKLRNGKTHGGAFSWGDSADIYIPLLALVYACFFRSAGVPDDVIGVALSYLF